MRAFIFPGQGSQAVGMGKALAEASTVARPGPNGFGIVRPLGDDLFSLLVRVDAAAAVLE